MVSFYVPPRPRAATNVTVTCTDLDLRGRGVCKEGGHTRFVPGVLPGETAVAAVRADQAEGTLVRLLSRSPARVSPSCPQAASCGGCPLAHVPPGQALAAKIAGLRRLYAKVNRRDLPPPAAAVTGPETGYRRAARLALRCERGRLRCGFRAAGSHAICPVTACACLTPRLNSLLAPFAECLARLSSPAALGHVEWLDSDGACGILLRVQRPLPPDDIARLREWATARGCLIEVSPVAAAGAPSPSVFLGDAPVFVSAGDVRVDCTPGAFVQVNAAVNRELTAAVLRAAAPAPGKAVLDLFCGTGNFSLPLAAAGCAVTGVELAPAMVRSARNAASRAGLPARFFVADLRLPPGGVPWERDDYAVVVGDPGRAGAPEVAARLGRGSCPRLIWVACAAAAAVREAGEFIRAGFALRSWEAFDMFPQTEHIETVWVWDREG